MNQLCRTLQKRIKDKKTVVGVVGLGYVGLPLVKAFLKKGFAVTGFDIDRRKVDMLNQGKSYIKHITATELRPYLSTKRFAATTEFARLTDVDAVLICVPTPLDDHRNPDLSFVLNTTETIARHLRKGQLVVLESTTYPGTTDEEMLPILERGGLKAGKDFFLAFSPERENALRSCLYGREHSQGRRRPDQGLSGAGRYAVQPGRGQDGPRVVDPGGGVDQAPGKHLPLRQHRPGERAEDDIRPDGDRRLGSDPGGFVETLRVHALLSRARPGRALHPHRPVLPDVEGAGGGLFDEVH